MLADLRDIMPSSPDLLNAETRPKLSGDTRLSSGEYRKPLHVVHLVMALNVGGLERVVMDLVQRLDRTRFRCTILCIKERGVYAQQVEEMGVPVASLDCGSRGLRTRRSISR